MKYLIVTKWSYPMGGGEEFMYQTMKWMKEAGNKVYWISFTDLNNKEYQKFELIKNEYGKLLHINQGMNYKNLFRWVKLLQPDIIHHQGSERKLVLTVANDCYIPFITGYHFWNGGIILHNKSANINILGNITVHKKDEELDYVMKNSSKVYVASEFMKEVFKKVCPEYNYNVVEPIPDEDLVVAQKYNINNMTEIMETCVKLSNRKYVTMVNIHKFKGGELLLKYLIAFPNIPFMCIRTEPLSVELDEKIRKIVDTRPHCKFLERVNDMKPIYKDTKILLVLSIVDETYCRVAAEGIMNFIPVMTTGSGNIKNIVGDAGIYDLSTKMLDKLYNDNHVYINCCISTIKRSKEINSEISKKKFTNMISSVLLSRVKRVMFFVPWTDQGLGIQAKNYVKLLGDECTCVFSYKPYNGIKQASTDEWYHQNIYYSNNIRERVTDEELINFVKKYNVVKCIIPETCFFRVFQICTLLKKYEIKMICIPNIEIVRSSEVLLHNKFDEIWCNNDLCKDVMKKYIDEGKLFNIYFGIESYQENIVNNDDVTFLFLGGHNAFSRKNVLKVLEAFNVVRKHKLICCIQSSTDQQIEMIGPYLNCENIQICLQHMSCEEVSNLYLESDCVVQVSSHEGLGLGFYESLAHGLPVVTLNCKPHNEVITPDVGFNIKCYDIPVPDNKESLIRAACFDVNDLIDCLNKIDMVKIKEMKVNCQKKNKLLFENFKDTFVRKVFD